MPKKAKELSALAVSRITSAGFHSVGGVAGLSLRVVSSGARNWILRVVINGKRCDMGLGGFPDVPLADAKNRAREARDKIRQGNDPIEERRLVRSKKAAERAAALTFSQCANRFIEAKSPEWKNAKHLSQWQNTLNMYVFPTIGHILIKDVNQSHVLSILEPIWKQKTETASRLRGRIENILDWATARGYRQGENPARWRGHLDKLLAKPSKVAPVQHYAALPYSQISTLMGELQRRDGVGALALQFCILTAARSGEVRGATWEEIDIDKKLWIIPKERMKAGREHRVPLSPTAIDILQRLKALSNSGLIFPSPLAGKPLTDATLSLALKRVGYGEFTVHGFRSTFRDWAAEMTNYPRDMAEMALAHTISDATEAAYRRGDMLEKRFQMMKDWAAFCSDNTARVFLTTDFKRAHA